MPKILGLDYGQRKIGVAVADTDHHLVFVRPAILLGANDAVWPALHALVKAEQPHEIIVGLPKNTDGTEGPQAAAVRAFVRQASQQIHIPIRLWDERLTTQAVQREQVGRDMKRGQEDSLVAQRLLEEYLSTRP